MNKKYSPEKLPLAYRSYFTGKFTREELIEKLIEEVKKLPAYHAYISGFQTSDPESFLKSYAEKKASVLLDSDEARDQLEFGDSIFRTYASERFWDIQQKKLFDLQCLWRAEKIKIAEVESTWDFHYWSENIKSCPFLDPITEDELNLYIDFLKATTEELDHFEEWQAYDEIKESEQNGEGGVMPEWYDFHNTRTGNGTYLTFPDIRGQKEEFYRKIWAENKQSPKEESNKPHLPYLSALPENIEGLMTKIETPEFQKMYWRYEKMQDILNSQEEVEEAFYFLRQLYQEVPIDAASDWREALIRAKQRYINQKIAEEMPLVFEEYQMKQSLGIMQGENEEKDKSFYESLKEPVREGRRLNGEPPDFNF